jgi:hypothetical protein
MATFLTFNGALFQDSSFHFLAVFERVDSLLRSFICGLLTTSSDIFLQIERMKNADGEDKDEQPFIVWNKGRRRGKAIA